MSVGGAYQADRRTRSQTLHSFCLSFGFQRHSYFILRAISVFYFASILQNREKGLQFHNYFFAALSLAPVCVGAVVTTLAGQRRAVYLGQLLLISAFALLALDLNRYLAGACLIAGIGLFKVSFKTVFSASMRRFDEELDVHFTRLYLAINIGSFLAPLVVAHFFSHNPNGTPPIPPPSPVFAWCGACMLLSLCFGGMRIEAIWKGYKPCVQISYPNHPQETQAPEGSAAF